ncbi:MAG: hypothetical protein QOE61_2415 [Micromonosporaceae bacterium]|nr:hypothetical protein [Micromonosporaceae bacterium]
MGSTSTPGVRNAASAVVGDERAVRAVVDAVSGAWADNDATAFVDHYAEDATAILPGFALRNRVDIRTNMAKAFAAQLKGSRRIHQVQSVRFPGDATAIVISRSSTVFPRETEPAADRWSLATWVLSQHSGRWLIEAYHDCPAA